MSTKTKCHICGEWEDPTNKLTLTYGKSNIISIDVCHSCMDGNTREIAETLRQAMQEPY